MSAEINGPSVSRTADNRGQREPLDTTAGTSSSEKRPKTRIGDLTCCDNCQRVNPNPRCDACGEIVWPDVPGSRVEFSVVVGDISAEFDTLDGAVVYADLVRSGRVRPIIMRRHVGPWSQLDPEASRG